MLDCWEVRKLFINNSSGGYWSVATKSHQNINFLVGENRDKIINVILIFFLSKKWVGPLDLRLDEKIVQQFFF